MENANSQIEQNNFDIAVIGMAGRFPGAKNIDEFWHNLISGTESITFFSDKELLESGVDPALLKDPNYVKAGPFLDKKEYFDASFFKFSPREAAMTDPQHRIFLECAWETLENAGYDADRYGGSIGVYAGASMNTYLLSTGLGATFRMDDLATLISSDKDFLTTRVSYKLNLRGPSITIGCACSTSLVAIHIACQSLLNQDCDMALAGGVSVRVPQKSGYLYREGDIVSPDGHCRTFDANAQGTVFGCGAGVVLLKRLYDAIADGDCIRAVIKGSAINNDGSGKVGYTAPSVDGQSRVFLQAMANAGVSADTISYIEAHGSGTSLGDPIEVTSLTRAFRSHTDKKGYCAIGSVKTNIGHLDTAAGIASFIKTVLALEHKIIPPTLHFQKANPEIDFPNSPFYVNNKLIPWESQYPRRAGVSSFGIGGTNAHVILEEAPVINSSKESRPWQLLLLSAKTGTALETATKNFTEHLKHHRDLNLADVAFTLQNGRKAFDYRRMLVCQNTEDAVNALETGDQKRVLSSVCKAAQKDVVFIFSGQGSQYVNMGLELYKTEPVFREEVDRCAGILRSHLGLDLREVIYPPEDKAQDAEQKLLQTFITQPALFTIEYALARLWMSWGVHPAAMVGHSIGEYVAACLAGVFSLEDALTLVAARGRLIQELPGGSMLAVFLPEKEVQPWLNDKLSLAVINGPSLCVVSGEKEVVADLEKRLSEKKVDCRHVHTSHAFHSKMMEPILNAFVEQVKQVKLNVPQIPFVSNYTGKWIVPDEATNPDYWARHLRHTIRFADCLQELLKEPDRVLLEVGPGSTFSTLARQHPDAGEHVILATTRHPKEKTSDVSCILNTLGQLWMAGIEVDWTGFYKDEVRHRLPLPTYPFERQRHWIEAKNRLQAGTSVSGIPEGLEKASGSIAASTDIKTRETSVVSVNNVEELLAEIWQEILGVKGINYSDDFFELGGTSLIAVSLFSEINKAFGKKLPLATLYQAPTIKQLADCIRKKQETKAWSSLVAIQSGGPKPPLFLVHAAGGNVLIYRDLVRHIGPEQPVYGLQSQGLDGEQPFNTRIEDMAAQYVSDILTIQPRGPYLLAGYCMGGTVALEMAQQLRAQGREVALLALFETYNWANIPAKTFLDDLIYYLQKIGFVWGKLLLSKNKMEYILEKTNVVWGRSNMWLRSISSKNGQGSGIEKDQYLTLFNLRRTNDEAALAYVPKAYPGKITQFVPEKEYAQQTRQELSLDTLAAGGLEVYDMPTYPGGMFVEPFAEILAAKLKACIEKALELDPSNKR